MAINCINEGTPSYFDIVFKYLEGDLNNKEKETFEQELRYNVELKEELSLQEKLNHFLNDKELLNFIEIVNEVENKFHKNSIRNKLIYKHKTRPKKLIASAIGLLLIVIYFLNLFNFNNKSNEEFYIKYNEFILANNTTRAVDQSTNIILDRAYKEHDKRNFTYAIKLFEDAIIESDSEQLLANFYLGQCYMNIEQYDKALEAYNRIINDKENLLIEDTYLKCALIYLKLDNRERSIEYLKKSYSIYQSEQVKRLLNDLE